MKEQEDQKLVFKVTVVSSMQDYLEGTLEEVISNLEQLKAEHGKDAEVHWDRYYGDSDVILQVNKEETDEEFKQRINLRDSTRKRIEEKERAQLAALKAKYGE